MTPDLLKIYLEQIKKITQRDIAQKLNEKGVACTQDQVSRTLTGERRNEHLRKHIEEVIEMPNAFDAEFDVVTNLRRQIV